MRNHFLLMLLPLLLFSCKTELNDDDEESFMLKGTVYYYFDPGFVFSNCSYVFESEDGKTYIIYGSGGLRELSNEIESNNGLAIRINYENTELTAEDFQCLHNKEWLPASTPYIRITSFKVID